MSINPLIKIKESFDIKEWAACWRREATIRYMDKVTASTLSWTVSCLLTICTLGIYLAVQNNRFKNALVRGDTDGAGSALKWGANLESIDVETICELAQKNQIKSIQFLASQIAFHSAEYGRMSAVSKEDRTLNEILGGPASNSLLADAFIIARDDSENQEMREALLKIIPYSLFPATWVWQVPSPGHCQYEPTNWRNFMGEPATVWIPSNPSDPNWREQSHKERIFVGRFPQDARAELLREDHKNLLNLKDTLKDQVIQTLHDKGLYRKLNPENDLIGTDHFKTVGHYNGEQKIYVFRHTQAAPSNQTSAENHPTPHSQN